jgi:hypothetical protein
LPWLKPRIINPHAELGRLEATLVEENLALDRNVTRADLLKSGRRGWLA